MIMDELTEFCDATALNTGAAGTYLVGDVIDLGADGGLKALGNGREVFLVIRVDTTATSGGSATVNLQLASDAQAAIATDGSATVHYQTGAKAFSDLTKGTMFVVPLPADRTYERYLGILQVEATAALTGGKIDAFLTLDPHGWFATPEGAN